MSVTWTQGILLCQNGFIDSDSSVFAPGHSAEVRRLLLNKENNRTVINNWNEEGFLLTDHIWQVIQLKICHCHFSSMNSERMVLH